MVPLLGTSNLSSSGIDRLLNRQKSAINELWLAAIVRLRSPTAGATWGPWWGPRRPAESGPHAMSLTDMSIRALAHGDKPIKKADEKGLFLLLQPGGGKLWRFKYRFAGKEKKLGLGRYPDVSLKEARRRRDVARQTLANGVDPGEEKKREAQAAADNAANTFGAVGDEYLEKMGRDKREAVTINKSRWLLSLFGEGVLSRPIADLTPAELLKALQRIEAFREIALSEDEKEDFRAHFTSWRDEQRRWSNSKDERAAVARQRAAELRQSKLSYTSIAARMNDEKILSLTGRAWTGDNVRKLLADKQFPSGDAEKTDA